MTTDNFRGEYKLFSKFNIIIVLAMLGFAAIGIYYYLKQENLKHNHSYSKAEIYNVNCKLGNTSNLWNYKYSVNGDIFYGSINRKYEKKYSCNEAKEIMKHKFYVMYAIDNPENHNILLDSLVNE